MGYLIGISMVLMMSGNYLEYAAGRNVQLFEPFIVAITSPTYSIFIMMGLLLTLLDAPFINIRTPYLVTRGSRGELVQRNAAIYVHSDCILLYSYVCIHGC